MSHMGRDIATPALRCMHAETPTRLDGLHADMLEQDSSSKAGSRRPAAPTCQRPRPQRQHRATSRVIPGCEEGAPQITLACLRRALAEHRTAEAKMQVMRQRHQDFTQQHHCMGLPHELMHNV